MATASSGSAQRLINFNMADRHIAALQCLLSVQQGANTGAPGGLGNPLTAEELEVLIRHTARFRCESVREPLSKAPDEPDAHEAVHKHITVLMDKIIATKWFLKDLEAVALEWLAMQFKGSDADHWTHVVAVARVTVTTSGIGHNSVLYRCLRNMVLAYPATGIKANLLLRKTSDLPWNSRFTVVQTASQTSSTMRLMIVQLGSLRISVLPFWSLSKTGQTDSQRCKYIFPSGPTSSSSNTRAVSPPCRRAGLSSLMKLHARLRARL